MVPLVDGKPFPYVHAVYPLEESEKFYPKNTVFRRNTVQLHDPLSFRWYSHTPFQHTDCTTSRLVGLCWDHSHFPKQFFCCNLRPWRPLGTRRPAPPPPAAATTTSRRHLLHNLPPTPMKDALDPKVLRQDKPVPVRDVPIKVYVHPGPFRMHKLKNANKPKSLPCNVV